MRNIKKKKISFVRRKRWQSVGDRERGGGGHLHAGLLGGSGGGGTSGDRYR